MASLSDFLFFLLRKILIVVVIFFSLLSWDVASLKAEDTSKWKLYQNKEKGIAVKFPKDWQASENKGSAYDGKTLAVQTHVCFSSVGNNACLAELYVTDQTNKFHLDPKNFLGLPVFETAEAEDSPRTKDGLPTRRLDTINAAGEYFANIYLEKDDKVYLFVMKDFNKDLDDYSVFLSLVSTFVFFDPPNGRAAVIPAKLKEFEALDEKALAHAVIKLSEAGLNGGSFPTMILSPGQLDPSAMAAQDINPDQTHSLQISAPQLKSLIKEIAHSGLVSEKPISAPYLFLSIFNPNPNGDQYFETALNQEEGRDLFVLLRQPFKSDRETARIFQLWGCESGLLPQLSGADMTAQVEINESGIRFNKTNNQFEQTLTVKNISRQAIPGPISIAFDFKGETHLADPDGLTCRAVPAGREFINIPLPSGQDGRFFPQESLELTLPFKVKEGEAVSYTPQVIANAKER